MRHTKTPEETGWYWIANHPHEDEDWRLCYLYAEESPQVLIAFDPDAAKLKLPLYASCSKWTLKDGETRWSDHDFAGGSWCGPEVWYGPLPHPGGDFGDCIVEAEESTHAEAEKSGKAIVIEHVDYTHCNHTGGTVTCVKLMNQDEALAKERTA